MEVLVNDKILKFINGEYMNDDEWVVLKTQVTQLYDRYTHLEAPAVPATGRKQPRTLPTIEHVDSNGISMGNVFAGGALPHLEFANGNKFSIPTDHSFSSMTGGACPPAGTAMANSRVAEQWFKYCGSDLFEKVFESYVKILEQKGYRFTGVEVIKQKIQSLRRQEQEMARGLDLLYKHAVYAPTATEESREIYDTNNIKTDKDGYIEIITRIEQSRKESFELSNDVNRSLMKLVNVMRQNGYLAGALL